MGSGQDAARFVGIDISKNQLEVHVRPGGERWQAANEEDALEEFVQRLCALEPALIVLEASGGYERRIAALLTVSGLQVAIVNPRQVRDFGRALGRLAKTDRIDAEVIARFAEAVRPEPRALLDEPAQRLDELVARRRQLTRMITAEKNRRGRQRTRGGGAPDDRCRAHQLARGARRDRRRA
jgi:transposase